METTEQLNTTDSCDGPIASLRSISAYATGEGAVSLTVNSVLGFSMLYYTQALGLDSKWAGLALSVTMFWDAITDPIMGHISDNTRSRFGRRHPYILIGGVLLAISFYFIWAIPEPFRSQTMVFWYILSVNLLFRTALTIFIVPYTALGFEVCTDYDGRSKLQSFRFIFNMAANLLGPALAWPIFFANRGDIDGTHFKSNYHKMGTVFSITTLIIVLFCVFSTRRYAVDTRQKKHLAGNKLSDFFRDIRDILLDKNARVVFTFFAVATFGTAFVASLQMYTYIHYMHFTGGQKGFVHGLGMAGFAIGSVLAMFISKKLDKKPAVYIAACLCIVSNLMLLILFVGGIIDPRLVSTLPWYDITVPVSVIVFAILQASYWMGSGIMQPVVTSMIADISEVNKHRTGILKDGSYSAMFAFVMKGVWAVGLFLQGLCLSWAGFVSGSDVQLPAATTKVAAMTFVFGALFASLAILIVRRYRIDRKFMTQLKANMPDAGLAQCRRLHDIRKTNNAGTNTNRLF
ncbi:MAG: MFS transporter [Phycisphaerae bacterium]|nr:MFS transporter [Phycisphaerae bacterium]